MRTPNSELPSLALARRGGLTPNSGFTLIEAIVSVSIFSIAVTSIVGVYLAVQRLNAESLSLQAVQQNGRVIVEDLTKMIRNGSVNYAGYGGSVPQPSTETLRLINQDNEAVAITRQGDQLILTKAAGSSALTGDEVRVLAFRAFIWPATNPFPGGVEKPVVTVYLNLESDINPRDRVRIPFQTTATTREYPE